MLIRDMNVFLQRPEEFAARILHLGKVVDVDERRCSAALAEPLPLEVGQDLHIYFELERQFMQQPARITAVEPIEVELDAEGDPADASFTPRLAVEFETTGGLISAECRECYRVSTVTADLTAAVGDEKQCRLTDVSATGFSVIASGRHAIGDVVPATLRFEDKQFTGSACVQSVKELMKGETRYGLKSLPSRGTPNLEQGQQQISMAIQRLQLRRLAGNG